ncbi:MAG: 5-oxoprolinase subunit PxpA [Bacteroidota bacterium]
MKKWIDLNCDLGESYGRFKVGNDEGIMPYITSCNIACGFHGGDPLTIIKTILLATKYNVQVGAHPGFPDLQGFGRRPMKMSADELSACVKYQVAALKSLSESNGIALKHVKPHGALYNVASKDLEFAKVLIEAVKAIDTTLIFVGPSMNVMQDYATSIGVKYASEVFADRHYNEDLTLVSRTESNAMITDDKEAEQQVLDMVVNNEVTTVTGKVKSIKADTICLHGDQPDAVQFAKTLNQALTNKGLTLKAHAEE